MDIHGAIKKATQIPKTNGDASFVRLQKPDQATLDRNMNKRKLKAPRNIKLIEQDDLPSAELHDWNTKYTLNENEILSSIKAVNGGVSYSNKSLEDHWKLKQSDCNSNMRHFKANTSTFKSSCSYSNITETSNVEDKKSNKPKENIENNEDSNSVHEVLKKCKLSKNAVILGLLNSNKITLEDLQIPEKSNFKNEKSQTHSDIQTDDIARKYLLQHPDEPDVYIHSLQMMEKLEKSKGNMTNFIVEHVGVKKTITPQQYYVTETDDTSFKFVKKNVKDK
ncbi:hypothetical protein KPH14_008708 [Odynerus spinipes]|uniref:Uncharacterized protein n=1 Tax=Odynerus spinipes TaxID=1348599 RepID=A0AAD9R8T5_9HYME|nr:hypothetical protein KPH14_008708 [Odynerus spinipes]